MSNEEVPVTAAVLEGLEAVRSSGLTNMFDRPQVVRLAEFFGYEETAKWVSEHHMDYATGVFHGFTVDDREAGAEL